MDQDVWLLSNSNMVTPVVFKNHTIQIADKRQRIVSTEENIWGAREIAPGLVAVGYNNRSEVDLFRDGKVDQTFALPNVEVFGFHLLPNWDPLWNEPDSDKPRFLAIDAHKFVLIDLEAEKEEHRVRKIYGVDMGMFNINSETRNDFEPMGGYMPRLLIHRIDSTTGRFVVMVLRMFTDCSFDLVQIYLEEDCRIVRTTDIADRWIYGSPTL